MAAPAAVLKRHRIKPGDPCRLAAPAHASPHTHHGPPARVAVVRTDRDGAVLEVTCGCGRKTVLECRWATPEGAAPDPTPSPKESEDA